MTEIALKIANQVIQLPEPRPRLVAGSAGVYAVTLAYDAQWDDATVRVVVFDGGLCNQRVPVQDTSGTVTIPAECIAHGGRGNWLQIGVLGFDGTGALRITTRAMLDGLRIDPAGVSDADVPQDPPTATPGLWEQLVADVGNLSDLQTADTSSLVAAINELAAKPAGYKPYPITLTQSGNKWTADHSYEEVKEALAQGYSPYCVYNSFPIPCTGVEDNFIYYTGWLGTQTTAVWIMQSKSGVTVVARNTFGVDRLTNLVDSDGGFGSLNTLIATNPRTAVVYNLGGTPEGQDLSAMTFPALLWGTATDATARTQTFGLTGAGGDQWRVVQNFDTKAVTFEQVGMGTKIYTPTTDQETETISVNCTWEELAAAVKSGATVMLAAGELGPGASHIVLTARSWFFNDDGDGEVYFQSDPGVMPGRVAYAVCYQGENGAVALEPRVDKELTEKTVSDIAYDVANDVVSDLEEQIAAIDKWELIRSVTTTEDVTSVVVDKDSSGKSFYLTKLAVFADFSRPGVSGSGTVTTNIPIYLGMNGVLFNGDDAAWLIGYSPTNTERALSGTNSVAVFEAVGGKMLPTHLRASLSDKDFETNTMVTNPTPLGTDLGRYKYTALERYSAAPCRRIELRNIDSTKTSIYKNSKIEVWGVRSR